MALSSSLDLELMLDTVLHILLSRLGAHRAMVFAGEGAGKPLVAIPRQSAATETLLHDYETRSAGLCEQNSHCLDLLPDGTELHRFSLVGFGVLVLERRGAPLAPEVLRALEPVMQRLGRAARAAADHALVRASEARFAELAATIPEVIVEFRLGTDGAISFDYVSPRSAQVTRLDANTLMEQPQILLERFCPEDRETFQAALVLAAERRESFEHRVRLCDDGEGARWLRIAGNLRGPREEGRWSGIIEDITAQQQVAAAEREATRLRMSSLLGLAGEAMVGADSSGRITHWNRAAEKLLGYPASTILGEPLTRIMPEHLRVAHEAGMANHMATGETRVLGRPTELPALNAAGQEIQIELVVNRVEDADEVFFIAVLRDLTERLRAEQERRRSIQEEQRFASALLGLGRTLLADPEDLQRRVTAVVAQALDVARVSVWSVEPGSLICLDLFEAADGRHSAGDIVEEQADSRPYFAALRDESAIIAPDSHTHWATSCFRESYLEPLGIASKLDVPIRTLEGLMGVLSIESTDRRDWRDTEVRFCLDVAALLSQASERMVRARLEARHEIVLASIGDAVIACDTDQSITLINPAAENLTGWSSAEALGRPLGEVFHVVNPETLDPVETLVTDVLTSNLVGPIDSVHLINRDGEQIPIASSIRPISEFGTLTGAVLTFRDVREEQASRRALEEQNRRLQALREAIPDMLFSVSIDGQMHYEKATPSPDLLVSPKEMSAHTVRSIFPPKTAAQILRAVDKTARTGEVQTVEYTVEAPQGPQYFEARFARLNDHETTAIVRNITEARFRENSLREERARLEMVLASTSAIIYSAQLPDFKVDYISNSAVAVLGFTPEEFQAPGFWEHAIHPDDAQRVMIGLERLFETGSHTHEYRHRHKAGGYRWLRDQVRIVANDFGGPPRAIGASFDITERKVSESRLISLLVVQQIVARMSSAFLKSYNGFDEAVFTNALRGLGEHTKADRAYVFESDDIYWYNTYEWCKEGVAPQKDMLQRMCAADFDLFLVPFRQGNPLYISSVANLPPEAALEKEILSAQDIESLVAVPMFLDGEMRGFIGLDNPDLGPMDPFEFVELMQLLADTLAAGIQRVSIERALRDLNHRLTSTLEKQHELLELSTDIARTTSRDELFATLRDRVSSVLGVDRLSIMEKLDDDGRKRFRILDSSPEGVTETESEFVTVSNVEREVDSDMQGSAVALAIERKTAVTSQEFPLDEFPDWVHLHDAFGYTQFMVIPLIGASGPFGTLNVSSKRPEPPTSEEIDWISTFGSMLAAHLTVHEAREELQRLNTELEARVELRTRELRASEASFETLFQNAPGGMLIVNDKQRIVQWNQRAQVLFRNDDELIGTSVNELVPVEFRNEHTHLMKETSIQMAHSIANARPVPALRCDGSKFSAEVTLVPINLNGERHIIAGVNDVTERLEAQQAVARSLREKETLLKEIHHRVKNNLQIISSLLTLQSAKMPSEDARVMLEESVFRVRSMAMIHQLLYGVDSLERIDFGEYARALSTSLRSALAPYARLRINASTVEFTVETAVPLGLILNELLTNSLKYGMPGPTADDGVAPRRTGEDCDILVEFGPVDEDNQVRLAVTDSGNGLPEGFNPHRSNTLGLRLVNSLSRQLRGKLDFDYDHGSRFLVTFPLPRKVSTDSEHS